MKKIALLFLLMVCMTSCITQMCNEYHRHKELKHDIKALKAEGKVKIKRKDEFGPDDTLTILKKIWDSQKNPDDSSKKNATDPLDKKAELVAPIQYANALYMIDSFRTHQVFNIPLSWTFTRDEINELISNPKIGRVRLYAGLKVDTTGGTSTAMMTLIAVGVDTTNGMWKDVFYEFSTPKAKEYADPCPPKCRGTSPLILPVSDSCYYRPVLGGFMIITEHCQE